MIFKDFGQQTDSLHGRLEALHKQIIETSLPAKEQSELAASFKEVFFTTMEELHVVETELTQQNEELMAARINVELERRRYQELFEFAPDAYLVTDPAGLIREANRAAAELLNRPQAFLIGKPFSIYIAAPSWRVFRMALRSLETLDKLPERIVRVVPRHSPPFAASITAAPVRGADNAVIAVRWLVRDVSERIREQDHIVDVNSELERRVAARAAELEEANQAKDALLIREMAARAEAETANTAKDHFLAVLSHELRTPLTPVVMTVAALESDESLPAQVREDLAMVHRNIELETKLIDDLLDLSRITHGKVRLHRQIVDIHDLVGRVLDMCESEITSKRLRVSKDLAAIHSHVNADPARLQQILWNLVKNAVKFTPASGEVAIRTGNSQTDPQTAGAPSTRRLVIEVRDSGIGIEPQTLPRIFDAFEQGEKTVTRRFGGLGLGLSISRALANLHDGTLKAHSAGKDQGAIFTLELPAEVSAPPPKPHSGEPPSPAPDHHATRVLLVEDHADTARMLARLLRSSGYEVKTAGTVADALQLSASEPFDILVSDLGLPDGSGLELMREIRARSPLNGIALTGFGMDTDIKATHDAGFAEHLTKPVNLRALELAIDRLAARKAQPV